jgi:hypothetical protein
MRKGVIVDVSAANRALLESIILAIEAQVPVGKLVHVVLANYATHKRS